MKSSVVVSPGTGYFGSRASPNFRGNVQRRATSTEFASASGTSENISCISSGVRRYCSRV